jgi:hypothetical protein
MTDYAQYNLRRRDNPQHVYALGSDLDGFPESTNQTLSRILMGGSNKRRKLATKSNVAACELCGETLASSSSLSTDKSSLCDTCTKQSSTPSTTLSCTLGSFRIYPCSVTRVALWAPAGLIWNTAYWCLWLPPSPVN